MGDKRGRSGGEKSTLAQEVHYSAQLSQAKVAPGQRGSRRWPGGGALRLRPRRRSQNNLAPPTRLSLLFIKPWPVFPFVFFLHLTVCECVVSVRVCVSAGSTLMGLEWQRCCYLSGLCGRDGGGNGEEHSPMGGDSDWMEARGGVARFFVAFLFFSRKPLRKYLIWKCPKLRIE